VSAVIGKIQLMGATQSDPTPVKEVLRQQRSQRQRRAQQRRDEIEDERTRQSKAAYEQMMQAEQEERIRIQLMKQTQLRKLLGMDSEQTEPVTVTPNTDESGLKYCYVVELI